jgi:hypothetical protein
MSNSVEASRRRTKQLLNAAIGRSAKSSTPRRGEKSPAIRTSKLKLVSSRSTSPSSSPAARPDMGTAS